MSDSFVVEVSRANSNSSEPFYTTNTSITVGNDLQNSIRIREPSIEKVHLQIFFDKMSIFVSGKDVYLNENPLEVGQTYPFSLGDTIKIHDVRLTINKTESKQEGSKQEGTVIKPIPTETISELNTIPADEVEVVAMIEKDEKEIFIKKEVHTNQFIEGDVLVQEVTEKIQVEENQRVPEIKKEEGTNEEIDLKNERDRESLQTEELSLNNKNENERESLQTEELSLKGKEDTFNTTEELTLNKGDTFIKDSVDSKKQ
ncbi:hypothetical protein NBO_941g0002 [Nosema bombycis CQ1]|uniref:FHA domain-containing protein n=1 Tax=Nosema bombycis (strain CQ1 / CVCC 102059) TaxID=578461 RepID=R0MC90_NOSB1|nr:hypothetical protein NBO_941g0002 [Nosema bombycis CQ1]|eukprot:EOB11670.1 hypothetical protein NBO_941g0002 [Nosema bombycis CQ1]